MSKKKALSNDFLEENKKLKLIFESKKHDLGINQADLAEILGISQVAVSYYLNGINALNLSTAYQFAKILNIRIQDFSPRLAEEIKQMMGFVEVQQGTKIGNGNRIGNNNDFSTVINNNHSEKSEYGDWETAYTTDNALYPTIPQNTQIWFNPKDKKIQDGKTYLIEYGGLQTVRRLFAEADGQVRLKPYHTDYSEELRPTEQVRIIGRVVQWCVRD